MVRHAQLGQCYIPGIMLDAKVTEVTEMQVTVRMERDHVSSESSSEITIAILNNGGCVFELKKP